jgi:hypothetical protein
VVCVAPNHLTPHRSSQLLTNPAPLNPPPNRFLRRNSTRELVSVARALKFLLIRQGPLRPSHLHLQRGNDELVRGGEVAVGAAGGGSGSVGGDGGDVGGQLQAMNATLQLLMGKVLLFARRNPKP